MRIPITITGLFLLFAFTGAFAQGKVEFTVDRDTISTGLDETGHPHHAYIKLSITNLNNDTLMIPPAGANFQEVLVLSEFHSRKHLEAISVCGLALPQWQTLPPGQSGSVSVDVAGPFFKLSPGKIRIRLQPLIYKYKKGVSRPIENEIRVRPKKVVLNVLPSPAG